MRRAHRAGRSPRTGKKGVSTNDAPPIVLRHPQADACRDSGQAPASSSIDATALTRFETEKARHRRPCSSANAASRPPPTARSILDSRERAVGSRPIDLLAGEPVLHRLPVHGVVDVAVGIDVGRPQRPGDARRARRRRRQESFVETARPLRRIRPEVPDPCRALIAVEVDPHAVDLDRAARVSRDAPAPAGRDRGNAAAPGRELDLPIAKERRDDVDLDASDDPQMVRDAPAGLLDVVDRRVLEEPGDRIEAHPAVALPISEA